MPAAYFPDVIESRNLYTSLNHHKSRMRTARSQALTDRSFASVDAAVVAA